MYKSSIDRLGVMPRRIITQVKVFSVNVPTSDYMWRLEYELNSWLEEQGPAFRLLDVKLLKEPEPKAKAYTVLVVYSDLEPLDEEV